MKLVKKIIAATVITTWGLGMVVVPKEAEAKNVSKVEKVVTLTKKSSSAIHKLSISNSEKVNAKVTFLEVKGKATQKDIYFGEYECRNGKGSFWMPFPQYKFSKNSFKKGKTLVSLDDDWINGKSEVEWYIPKGITKLKMKVTYFTKSGKAGIKSVK